MYHPGCLRILLFQDEPCRQQKALPSANEKIQDKKQKAFNWQTRLILPKQSLKKDKIEIIDIHGIS